MITFLPLPDFVAVAKLLDDKRLGSQRVEARFILRCVRNVDGKYRRFQNTGYVRMWIGHADALAVYYNIMNEEWLRRGFQEGISKAEGHVAGLGQADVPAPGWLGDDRLHSTHRAALLLKDPTHYGCLGWTEPPEVQYLWPKRRADGAWELLPPAGGKSQPSARRRAEALEASRVHWLSRSARRIAAPRGAIAGRKKAQVLPQTSRHFAQSARPSGSGGPRREPAEGAAACTGVPAERRVWRIALQARPKEPIDL